jgi:hypothetical protein
MTNLNFLKISPVKNKNTQKNFIITTKNKDQLAQTSNNIFYKSTINQSVLNDGDINNLRFYSNEFQIQLFFNLLFLPA